MNETDNKDESSLYRIEGLTKESQKPEVQRYIRTGSSQFWVAGIFMNEWVRQLDFEKLLKDVLSASVVGRFAGGWLQNLDFNMLPPDLIQYYQRAGAAYRDLEAAQAIWETIPEPIRMSGVEALREFHASRDWSHIIPRSLGGGDSASEGIFENASLNRARGDATMTPAELDLARSALNSEALRLAVEQAAKVAVASGLVAAVVEGVFATMEEGLDCFDGKITKSEFYTRVLKRMGKSVARAMAISGLIVGLVTVFPVLVPVLNFLAFPMAVVSFTLLGVKFYSLSAAWYQRLHLNPSLPVELLPDWFLNVARDATKGAPNWVLDKTKDVAVLVGDAAKRTPELTQDAMALVWDKSRQAPGLLWDARRNVLKDIKGVSGYVSEWVSDKSKDVPHDVSSWASQWFRERIWESQARTVDKD